MRELKVNAADRRSLERLIARPTAHAGHVRRARVVLLISDGVPGYEVAERVGLTAVQVSRIRRRFVEGGVAGLEEQKRSGRTDHAVPGDVIESIIQTTLSPPPAGRTRWTCTSRPAAS